MIVSFLTRCIRAVRSPVMAPSISFLSDSTDVLQAGSRPCAALVMFTHQEVCLLLAISWVGHILCGQCPRQ